MPNAIIIITDIKGDEGKFNVTCDFDPTCDQAYPSHRVAVEIMQLIAKNANPTDIEVTREERNERV